MNPRPLPKVVAIVGSRDYGDLEKVRALVRSLPEGACVLSGGARGVDQAAEAEAVRRELDLLIYRPRKLVGGQWHIARTTYKNGGWTTEELPKRYPHFPAVAHARNSMIVRRCVEESGAVVAFHNGSSPGTASVIAKAKAAGVLHSVYGPDGKEMEI